MTNKIEQLIQNQLSVWEKARTNYEALSHVKTKELYVNGALYKVQFNPTRIVSSGAKVDPKSILKRKCFLCSENRPNEQEGMTFGNDYTILINPFPIFPKHFTIPANSHEPQLILSRFCDMLDLAEYMSDYVIFYNGPKCGASAPDHAHFQAGIKEFLPLEKLWKNHISEKIGSNLLAVDYGFPLLIIETEEKQQAIQIFKKIYQQLEIKKGEVEPMLNILMWFEGSKWVVCLILRKKHRPDCYFAENEKNILISPASVDLGGIFITPLEKDFEKISADDIQNILNEVCFDKTEFEKIKKNIR